MQSVWKKFIIVLNGIKGNVVKNIKYTITEKVFVVYSTIIKFKNFKITNYYLNII